MTGLESKEIGQKLYKERQYKEAVPFLAAATESCSNEEQLWRELVLSASRARQHESAVEFSKSAIRHHPRSVWLWQQLGYELTCCDRLEEAEKALGNARTLNPNSEWVWRYYAALHKKRKNSVKEIEALEKLYTLGASDSTDLNSLGIAYHNQKNFAKALEYYRLAVETRPSSAPLFNMGLVFSDPEVSQDADASDAYRRALALKPDYERAKERLDATKRKLIPLAEEARCFPAVVKPGEYFQFYINPFEALQISEPKRSAHAIEVDAEGVARFSLPPRPGRTEVAFHFDIKAAQRAKKLLIQEIDLNDGKVSWLDDYPLDKSRALAMEDELHDERKRAYHWAIFCNKRLLQFLTRGDIGHFLFSEDYFPCESLELLDEEPEFRAFLSKPFARQYNVVLTRAIERRLLPVVEVLFDGRRWVEPEDDDVCFEGAYKRISELVESMRAKAEEGRQRKISVTEMEEFMAEHSFHPEMFNHLPATFRSLQNEVVTHIRSLAISSFNEHGDTALSRALLELSKHFQFKSIELNKRLEEDFKTIERMIAEEKKQLAEDQKHSFSAWVRQNVAIQIRKASIAYGGISMSASEIESIRWGVFVQTVNGIKTEHSFSLVVRSTLTTLSVEWGKRGMFAAAKGFFRKPGEVVPISELASGEQEAYFQKMIDAVIHHLLTPLIAKILERLHSGQSIVIGPCTLFQDGIAFRTGLVFHKEHHLPWRDVDTQMQSGQIHVLSRTNRKAQISMPAKDTDNAVILPIVCGAMREQSN